jgi:HEAT repeat protein
LKELKESGDLSGIIALWEEYAKSSEISSINDGFEDALLSFPREKFIPVLEEGMKSRQKPVSDWCIATLLEFHNQKALDFYLKSISMSPMTAGEEQRATELIESLKNADDSKRQQIADDLVAMGRGMVRLLLPLARGTDEKLALCANVIIIRTRLMGSRWEMMTTVGTGEKHPDGGYALKKVGGDRVLSVLREVLKNEPFNYDGVQLAMNVLAEVGTTKDADLIRPSLQGDNDIYAIYALSRLKDTQSVPTLVKILAEGHKNCAHATYSGSICYVDAVARALGAIGDKSTIEPMEKALDAEKQLSDKAGEHYIENARNSIITALARCGEKKYLYDLIDSMDVDQFPVELCGADEVAVVLERLSKMKNPDTIWRCVCWLNGYEKKPNETVLATLRKVREGLSVQKHTVFSDPSDMISSYLLRHGDANEKEKVLEQSKSDIPYARAVAISQLCTIKERDSFLPQFIEACDDRGEYIPPLSGTGTKHEVRETAIAAVGIISDEPFYLWDFDRDRQVAEIKAWYKKYQEQKAAEQKPEEQKPGEN